MLKLSKLPPHDTNGIFQPPVYRSMAKYIICQNLLTRKFPSTSHHVFHTIRSNIMNFFTIDNKQIQAYCPNNHQINQLSKTASKTGKANNSQLSYIYNQTVNRVSEYRTSQMNRPMNITHDLIRLLMSPRQKKVKEVKLACWLVGISHTITINHCTWMVYYAIYSDI